MLRDTLTAALKESMKARDELRTSTVRLILAALKDRDIAARTKGQTGGIADDEILAMLGSMIKQRRESAALYDKGGRADLVKREGEEIVVIESFMPKQIDDAGLNDAVHKAIAAVGAKGVKDLGPLMGWLKQHYAGQMDFSKAAGVAKQLLGAAA